MCRQWYQRCRDQRPHHLRPKQNEVVPLRQDRCNIKEWNQPPPAVEIHQNRDVYIRLIIYHGIHALLSINKGPCSLTWTNHCNINFTLRSILSRPDIYTHLYFITVSGLISWSKKPTQMIGMAKKKLYLWGKEKSIHDDGSTVSTRRRLGGVLGMKTYPE